MDLKNLMSHAVRPVNPTTTGELPAKDLAQLSEEDLQQIIGGAEIDARDVTPTTLTSFKDATRTARERGGPS